VNHFAKLHILWKEHKVRRWRTRRVNYWIS